MAIQLDIVTPERKIFSDEVDVVVVPGIEGEMGVLPQHAPLVTTLAPGELRYTKGNKDEELAIGQGFVEVTATKVSVLTDMAMSDDEIDETAVQEALERAEKSLTEKLDDEDYAATQASIYKMMAQLNLKKKRRGSRLLRSWASNSSYSGASSTTFAEAWETSGLELVSQCSPDVLQPLLRASDAFKSLTVDNLQPEDSCLVLVCLCSFMDSGVLILE